MEGINQETVKLIEQAYNHIEERTEGMKRQAEELIQQAYNRGFGDGYEKHDQELIEQAYNRGFEEGYKKGRKDGFEDWKDDITIDAKSYIERGRDEAWEAARKLVGTGYKECNEIFCNGTSTIETNDDIFARYTASEAIEKLNKFMEALKKQDEIKVGDEVILTEDSPNGENTNRRAVILINDGDKKFPYYVMLGNGDTEWMEKDEIDHKTGRNFPEIVEVLKKLKE